MRKKILRAILLAIVPLLASLFIRFLYLTNRKEFHMPENLGDDTFIMACWHGDLLMIPYAYKKCRKKPNVKIIISEHFDGNISEKIWSYFKFGSIRGSSTRGGAKALIRAIKVLKSGCDLGITPDGPKGPRHNVADGIIIMAQKADAKIILVEIKPTKYWQLKNWDKFVIPKPFGTIRYYISDLIDVKGMDMEDARVLIKKGLLAHEA